MTKEKFEKAQELDAKIQDVDYAIAEFKREDNDVVFVPSANRRDKHGNPENTWIDDAGEIKKSMLNAGLEKLLGIKDNLQREFDEL